ncbi:putative NAD-dependent epimerase/dehydratase [Coniella lustricola]|uniref:Putative NAD-dependent epimerase/dehydratase n=1 Tax=Coniella lustricola TaxID=2025994 RepID=A0A2T3ALI5_9PEZI|nr:putative NAD-dependent epimerase/dehydratase [Coniella lustricola]
MGVYAVLGATGNCGKALIKDLLRPSSSEPNTIHAYCRNKAKLYRVLPEVIDNKHIQIFDGSIQDVQLFADCLRGVQTAFLVVSSNDNIPGCTLAQDTARIVVEALMRLKEEHEIEDDEAAFQPPKLVLLSSASVDPSLSLNMPWWFRPIMFRAASNVYEDLRVTEVYLRRQEDWLTTIYVKPGGLAVDEAKGHRLTLTEEESFLSYADLSAGMIEAALDAKDQYDGKSVGVVHRRKGDGAAFPWLTPVVITMGLLRHFFPWLHAYLPMYG